MEKQKYLHLYRNFTIAHVAPSSRSINNYVMSKLATLGACRRSALYMLYQRELTDGAKCLI